MTAGLTLHNYFRSSTSVRVRIALNLKNLTYDYVPYALLKDENQSEAYLKLNPQGLVPALEIDEGPVLTQSLAIMEYLDEAVPEPAILPRDSYGRARVRSLSQIVAIDIHPINNLRVLRYLTEHYGADDGIKARWFTHWVREGFNALEARLRSEPQTEEFCHGDRPSIADICLYAQVLNNQRFGIDLKPWPKIAEIFAACDVLPAFQDARPEFQMDAV